MGYDEGATAECPRLFRHIQTKFQASEQVDKQKCFSYQLVSGSEAQETLKEKYIIIDDLRFENNILFGSIGITNKSFQAMVRQRDILTMTSREITLPSPTDKFEAFTFFAISCIKMKLAVLHNKDLPTYITNLITTVLNNSIGGEPFTFRSELFSEKTLKERLKELNQSQMTVVFSMHDIDMGKKPPFERMAQRAHNAGSCSLKFKGHYKYKLSATDIDDILDIATDGDCIVLKVRNDNTKSDSDDIDVLHDIVQEKFKVKLSTADSKNPAEAYKALISVFDSSSPNKT